MILHVSFFTKITTITINQLIICKCSLTSVYDCQFVKGVYVQRYKETTSTYTIVKVYNCTLIPIAHLHMLLEVIMCYLKKKKKINIFCYILKV